MFLQNHVLFFQPRSADAERGIRLVEVKNEDFDQDQKRRRDLTGRRKKRRLLGHEDQFARGIIKSHLKMAKKAHP